ncbi:MAG: hypothetical protein NZM31_01660 [Gemmatales bacterium]|nr:hypothetical protein [Gemmatales bacterium]MDW8385704.1 hypothetical protein [Gemmatales bacterium]
MPVILRDVPPGYHWGWYSREEPRMHLQIVDRQHLHLGYKVWLEDRGKRVFQPEPGIPAKVLKALREACQRERQRIEADWVSFMIVNGWLSFRLKGSVVELTAYPGQRHSFRRSLDLKDWLADPSLLRRITSESLRLNDEFAWLELFPDRPESRRVTIPLAPLLWSD